MAEQRVKIRIRTYSPPRDLNDARVTFTKLCDSYGLTLEQSRALWRSVRPPYPATPETKEKL